MSFKHFLFLKASFDTAVMAEAKRDTQTQKESAAIYCFFTEESSHNKRLSIESVTNQGLDNDARKNPENHIYQLGVF